MYMELSGTSQATAVAGGSAAFAREYLREVAGINKPSASLIKATLINGAEDLGTPNIPNNNEGWGQIDLENSLSPTYGGTMLDIFHDDARELQAGFSLVFLRYGCLKGCRSHPCMEDAKEVQMLRNHNLAS